MTDCGTIVVTGFGPFGEHSVNASWESVKNLPKIIDNFRIVTEEIQVSYDYVDKKVPELWRKYKPKLVIHVGVSGFTDKITIEKCANKDGYEKLDIFGACTKGTCFWGENVITTGLDCKYICDQLNRDEVKAVTSDCAGRYLCEYTYYTSLNLDKNHTLFIHVPPLNKPYTVEELTSGILDIIKCALELQD